MFDVTTLVSDTGVITGTEAETAAEAVDPGILPVILMGVGIVFAGIVVIAVICRMMLLIGSLGAKKKEETPAVSGEEEFKPDGELAAVIGAAVAEESGVDVKNIKIVSVKKVIK